jgi:hypothetical protein
MGLVLTTEGFILYSLFCLLFSAVTSTVIYFYQLTTPETAMPDCNVLPARLAFNLELFRPWASSLCI